MTPAQEKIAFVPEAQVEKELTEKYLSASGYIFKSPRDEQKYLKAVKRYEKLLKATYNGQLYLGHIRSTAYQDGMKAASTTEYNRGLQDGILKGKKEAQAAYNYQNTVLEAAKTQTAAMECLTRLVTAITAKHY